MCQSREGRRRTGPIDTQKQKFVLCAVARGLVFREAGIVNLDVAERGNHQLGEIVKTRGGELLMKDGESVLKSLAVVKRNGGLARHGLHGDEQELGHLESKATFGWCSRGGGGFGEGVAKERFAPAFPSVAAAFP